MEVLVADPDVAEQPLDVFAVKHVSEQHLVASQGFPGERGGGEGSVKGSVGAVSVVTAAEQHLLMMSERGHFTM